MGSLFTSLLSQKMFFSVMIKDMDLLFHNVTWMTLNSLLGIIAVLFGWAALKAKSHLLQGAYGLLWLLFIPNTIYMLTDLIHFPTQLLQLEGVEILILIVQYALLTFMAFLTFLLGLYPFEKFLTKYFKKRNDYVWVVLVVTNFVIAFGIVIGRVQRTNSWEVFTKIDKVIQDSINVFYSLELILLVIFFGILNNLVYYVLRRLIKQNEII